MSLFLTGGGDQEYFKNLDRIFIDSLPENAFIGILPQAADDPTDVLERIKQDFSHKKINNFQLLLNDQIEITQFDAIMIEGGNTFKLIQEIRETNFFSMLKKFYQSGKSIYADSAGAIMLGSDIQTAFLGDDADEDHLKLQDYRGIDLLSSWAIHAHATSDEFDDLNDLLFDKANPILALAEETGIYIKENELTVYGKEALNTITFAGKKTYPIGSKFNLLEF